MQCPRCKEPLIILEHDAVEVDYCVGCGGVWLDAGELELLLGVDTLPAGQVLRPGAGEKSRLCPMCGKRMEKHEVEGNPLVVYDRCARGDGLWLDAGELEALMHSGGTRVSAFLKAVFQAPGNAPPPD